MYSDTNKNCCKKNIAEWKLPHTGEELGKTATEAGHANNYIGDSNSACVDVVERKNEGRRREREQAECTWIGDTHWLRSEVHLPIIVLVGGTFLGVRHCED